jgi:hypothetical protein
MKTYTITGTYGMTRKTGTQVFVAEKRDGSKWYCVEGSVNINCTFDELQDGVDTEAVNDIDTLSADNPVNSIDDLIREIES